jgi:hypothetical protein
VLGSEALVKIDDGDRGTRDGLPADLAVFIDDATAKLHFGQMIGDACLLAGREPGRPDLSSPPPGPGREAGDGRQR